MSEMPLKECECEICTEHRKGDAIIATGDFNAIIKLCRDLQDSLACEGEDRCYYEAIVDGSWENADEVIAMYRKNPKARKPSRHLGRNANAALVAEAREIAMEGVRFINLSDPLSFTLTQDAGLKLVLLFSSMSTQATVRGSIVPAAAIAKAEKGDVQAGEGVTG
jgi:hypothetical protein